MEAFRRAGDEILRRWRAAEFDERLFPELVPEVLGEADLHRGVSLEALVDDVLFSEELPPAAVSKTFSDAGVCVYHDQRFVMEALTWLDASTAVHQHNFCGAFQVLAGSSLHTEYSFHPTRRINEQLSFGRLERGELTLLEAGAISPILAGDAFIHRLFHLERPSLSLVVRTVVQGASPQYAYAEPGIAFDPFKRPEELDQRIKMLRVLERLGLSRQTELLERLRRLIAESDLYTAFWYATEFASTLNARGALEELVPAVEDRFRDEAPLVVAAIDRVWRYQRIVALRRRATDPEHRFFLALLLNVADLGEFLQLVALRCPGEDSREKAVQWSEELSQLGGFLACDEEELDRLSAWLRADAGASAPSSLVDSILRPLLS